MNNMKTIKKKQEEKKISVKPFKEFSEFSGTTEEKKKEKKGEKKIVVSEFSEFDEFSEIAEEKKEEKKNVVSDLADLTEFSEFSEFSGTTEEKKGEKKIVVSEPSDITSDITEEKKEVKKISVKQTKEFVNFREKLKEKIPGNFRQKAEAVGVLPEDVKDFKYWLIDNREE